MRPSEDMCIMNSLLSSGVDGFVVDSFLHYTQMDITNGLGAASRSSPHAVDLVQAIITPDCTVVGHLHQQSKISAESTVLPIINSNVSVSPLYHILLFTVN